MLLQESKTNVERSANFVESSFKIKTTAKAFKILSSGLYSDKLRAIVRELGTNAADAHIMAGKPGTPFHVHLPNTFEPWFSIKDFGTGLSPEDIKGIYTTYFKSNKNESNDVTGCLGLGSKSPFSYTDTFTVVSCYNGRKYTYTAFLNEYGVPFVANLGEEDTSEENGIEVSFPVEQKDFNAFTEKAKLVYQHFSVRPVITGQTVVFEDKKPDYTGNNWKLYRGGEARHYLIMGNVAYPINLYEAECRHSLFDNVSIHIHCKIGEAEMTASRESLEYTERTKTVIKQAVDEALNQWTTLVLAELAAQPTYWEACLFYRNNQLWIKRGTEWNGRKVSTELTLTKPVQGCSTCKLHYGTKVKYKVNQTLFDLVIERNILFVEDDLARGTKLRSMAYVRNQNNKVSCLYILNFTDETERQNFFNEIGIPASMLIKASSLPKVQYVRTGNYNKKAVYKLTKSYTYSRRGKRGTSPNWVKEDFSDTHTGVYVELDRWQPIGYSNDTLYALTEKFKAIGKPIQIYGVRKSMLKKLVNNPKWQTMDDAVKEVVKNNESHKDEIMNCYEYRRYSNLTQLKGAISGIDITKLADKIEYVVKNFSKLSNLRVIMGRVVNDNDPILAMDALKAIEKKYPLLFFILENISSGLPTSDLVDYINMVNKQ